MSATIVANNVSKWFGNVVALSSVSFEIGPGVTALLGPNGAGKSTLLRVVCGLTPPSRGSVTVLGKPPRGDLSLYRSMGLVPQQEALFESLTGLEFVRVAAKLRKVKDPRARATEAIHSVELDPADPRPCGTYSKGMRQRLKLAAALVHGPEVVVLDEPLEGLDPRQRLRTIELVRRLGDEGRTVVVASHVLDEVERFGSRVLVVAQGRLAAEGDFRAIRALMDDRPHRLRISTDAPRDLAAGLLTSGSVIGTWVQDDTTLFVDTMNIAMLRAELPSVARDFSSRLYEVVPLDDDLESVFRYLVERRG